MFTFKFHIFLLVYIIFGSSFLSELGTMNLDLFKACLWINIAFL